MRWILPLVPLLAIGLNCPIDAQELPKAARISDVQWYQVTFIKFKPGKADEGRQIIADHFIKADEASGRAPTGFTLSTGEWDHVVFFPLAGGPSDLAWGVRPIDERWWAELARLEGGAAGARALVLRFNELIDRIETAVARDCCSS